MDHKTTILKGFPINGTAITAHKIDKLRVGMGLAIKNRKKKGEPQDNGNPGQKEARKLNV